MPGRELCFQGKNIRIEFEGSMSGFREIAMNPILLASCMEVATARALPYAISISPVDTGDYASKWKVEAGVAEFEDSGPSTIKRRVAALLVNTADHAAAVEWGNKATNGQGQHILRQTIDYLHATG